jgi:hypothetical protein
MTALACMRTRTRERHLSPNSAPCAAQATAAHLTRARATSCRSHSVPPAASILAQRLAGMRIVLAIFSSSADTHGRPTFRLAIGLSMVAGFGAFIRKFFLECDDDTSRRQLLRVPRQLLAFAATIVALQI